MHALLSGAALIGVEAGFAVDVCLRDATARTRYVSSLLTKLHAKTLIDESFTITEQGHGISLYADLTVPVEDEKPLLATSTLVDEMPLHFWGRRLKQQTQGNQQLREGLLNLFTSPLTFRSTAEVVGEAASEVCHVQ